MSGILDRARALVGKVDVPAGVLESLSPGEGAARRVGVACSGGLDSVSALFWALGVVGPEHLWVLHFDHGVRGEASAADARFVEALAAEVGARFSGGRRDSAVAGVHVSETEMRQWREAFFAEQTQALGLAAIITGHHANDVLETQILRWLRQSGVQGWGAPRPVSALPGGQVRLRPLLNTARADLEKWARALDMRWREDASNADDRHLRNAVRNRVVPVLEALAASEGRCLRDIALRNRETSDAAAALLDWAAVRVDAEVRDGQDLRREALAGTPVLLRRRILQDWLVEHAGCFPERAFTEGLLERLEGGAGFTLDYVGGLSVVADAAKIRIVPRLDSPALACHAVLGQPVPFPVGSEVYWPGVGWFAAHWVTLDDALREKLFSGECPPDFEVWLHPDRVSPGGLYLRQREPGERYRPLNAPGHVTLKALFNRRSVPVEERERIPVVSTLAREIVWRPRLPPSHAWRLSHLDERALRLTYRPITLV